MEAKLVHAAKQLPQPHLEFQTIEQKCFRTPKRVRSSRTLRLAAVAVMLVLCLCTTAFAYGKIHYGLWSGYQSSSFSDVEWLSRRYDYFFSEELNGSPFLQMSTCYAAPRGASHLDALLTPTYKLHSIDYGVRVQEQREDGLFEWTDGWISVSFGTTEKDAWEYHFSVAEDGSCSDENADPKSQQTVEYEGMTLHLYTIGDRHSVRWEDEQRKLVIDVTCWEPLDMAAALETATILIDQNR